MKSLLAICALVFTAALVRCDENQDLKIFMEATKEHFAPCAAEIGMANEPSIMLHPPITSPEDMDKLDCLHACIMKRLGIMDGGKLVADKMTEFVEKTFPEQASEMSKNTESCIEEANGVDGECGVINSFGKCLKKFA